MGTHRHLANEQEALRNELVLTAASQTLTAGQLKNTGVIVANKASAITITLPAAASQFAGLRRAILNKGAGTLSVAVAAGFGGSATTSVDAGQGDAVEVTCDGAYWYADYPSAATLPASGTMTSLYLGASATAGSARIYPATAANGYIALAATDMGGAWNLTLGNDAIAAARSYKIPDAGGDGKFVMTTAAKSLLVNANGSDRTMALNGNVSFGGAVTLVGALTTTGGAVTVAVPAAGATLTLGGSLTTSGAFATQFTIPAAHTYTFPNADCTLASATGAETGTTASTFTVDSDSGVGKFVLSVNTAGTNNTVTLKAPVTSQDVTLTLPDVTTDTVCVIAGTQTLAAKTLTAPVVNGMTTAAAANNFTLNTGSGAFTTPTGTFTHYGNVASNGNITFDFSGSNTTFKTSTGANTLGGDVTIAAGKQLDIGTASGGDATPLRLFSATAANGILVLKCQNDANNNTTTLQSGDPGAGIDPIITLPIATSTLATIGLAESLDTKTLTNAGAIAQTGAVAFTTGTGAVSLNGDVTIAGAKTLITGTGAITLKGSATFDTTKTLTFGAAAAGTAIPITMYSLTQNKGAFILASADNATNHTVTLTNGAANGAAATITTPNATCTLSGLGLAETFTGVKTFSAAPLITVDNATDNAVTDVLTLTHSTSAGTFGATGIGTGISIKSEDGAGNVQEIASIDASLTTVTDAAEYGDIIFNTMLNAVVTPAVTIDGSSASLTIGQNVTAPAGMFKLTVYPVTQNKGSLVLQAVANSAANVQTIIQNGQSGATSTFTTPTAVSGTFALTANATGAISRSDITEEALASHAIPVYDLRAADGNVLGIADTHSSGDHYLTYSAGAWALMGNSPNSSTQTDISLFQYQLPPNYVATGDVKLRVNALYTTVGDTQTVDLNAYEINKTTGAAGGDICTTTVITLTDTATAHDFTITATDLVAGDLISFILTTVFQDADGAVGEAKINSIELLCDVKG